MNELDSRILNALQNNFPLSEKPYDILSKQLGISTKDLWDRVVKLMDIGAIRRLGASLDSRKLGFSSTLAAISVPAARVERASEQIALLPEVTHSYLRKGEFNIWFTVIAPDKESIEDVLKKIQTALSLDSSRIINLPMKRLFKLDARFNVSARR